MLSFGRLQLERVHLLTPQKSFQYGLTGLVETDLVDFEYTCPTQIVFVIGKGRRRTTDDRLNDSVSVEGFAVVG